MNIGYSTCSWQSWIVATVLFLDISIVNNFRLLRYFINFLYLLINSFNNRNIKFVRSTSAGISVDMIVLSTQLIN